MFFGSRDKGKYGPESDIDLPIMDEGFDTNILFQLKNDFEENRLPCRVNIICYCELKNNDLKDHIDEEGVSLL